MKTHYFIILGSIIVLICFFCCSSKSNLKQGDIIPVNKEIYQLDKEQISNCFICNVEYFRMFHRYDFNSNNNVDSIKIIYNEYYKKYPGADWDPANYFEPYATRYSIFKGDYVNSPLPTKDQLKVTTDTIIYNKSGLLCVAFLVIECKYSNINGLEEARDLGREFDANAIIGFRASIDSSFKIYPLEKLRITGFGNYNEAIENIEELYFIHLKGIGSSGSVFEGLIFKQNVGDKDFFEKSPYFQKYDSLTYNFQMYRHLGKDYKFRYQYCE